MASSSAATLVAADRLQWEELPNGLVAIEGMTLGGHRRRFRVWAGLVHVEHVERVKSDLAAEDEPLRAMFNMD